MPANRNVIYSFTPFPLHILKIIPWSTVLLQKVIFPELKECSEFHGTRNFITVSTRARHLSLPGVRSVHSEPSQHRRVRRRCSEQSSCNISSHADRYGDETPTNPIPKMENRLLSAVRDRLFGIFGATFRIWGSSLVSATGGRTVLLRQGPS